MYEDATHSREPTERRQCCLHIGLPKTATKTKTLQMTLFAQHAEVYWRWCMNRNEHPVSRVRAPRRRWCMNRLGGAFSGCCQLRVASARLGREAADSPQSLYCRRRVPDLKSALSKEPMMNSA